MDDVVIRMDHVVKEFSLGQLVSVGQRLRNLAGRFAGRAPQRQEAFKALNDIHFEIGRGEVVGIIGHNGAGKSTMLKLLAGIIQPTIGQVQVNGHVAPLIEVGAGLVPEMTARENILVNGVILGMRRQEIERRFDEIVEFAEVERFVDTPVKRFSSGMQIRLGFAIATAVRSDVLIVDEVLAVGDLAFQRKCFDRIEQIIKREGRTVLIVSHNIRQIERLCTRAMLLERGQVIQDGVPRDVCNAYYERSDEVVQRTRAAGVARIGRQETSSEIEFVSLRMSDAEGQMTDRVMCLSEVCFDITYRFLAPVKNPVFGFGIHTSDFVYLATQQSLGALPLEVLGPGEHTVRFKLKRMPFLPGVYALRLGVALGDSFQPLYYLENAAHVRVVGEDLNRAVVSAHGEGFVQLEAEWSMRGADSAAL